MIGVISKDPVDGECVQGYELTKDAKKCMRAQEVDCNSPLCTGEKWRGGSIFCDEYAQVTGSRIAIGGCYDRNDNPEEYCVNYQDGKQNFCENTDICDDEGNIKSKDPECTGKGSPALKTTLDMVITV